MGLRLHYSPYSHTSRKVRLAAAELGIALELQPVDLGQGGQRTESFRTLNPNGKVPVLEDGGWSLWESTAIAVYLCETVPETPLWPREPRRRAEVHRWLAWEIAHLGRAATTLIIERVVKGGGTPAIIADGEAELARALGVLDGWLARHRHVAGDELSLADLAVAAPLMYRKLGAGFDVTTHDHVCRWLAAVEARESWRLTEP
jgi:glutathione S-transferase